jgi:phosphoribosylanthranilate isomerase
MELQDKATQVKICGLTRLDQAMDCAAWGADALGLIFYPPSPRYVTVKKASAISSAVRASICMVGVFVDETYDHIMRTARSARLDTIQLHGSESPELVRKIRSEGLKVIKTLFCRREPYYSHASDFPASAFLVECGDGPLPGGNAKTWDYARMKDFGKKFPFILAGGLSLENIQEALAICQPNAVDISSGVELKPGIKDMSKVKAFITTTQKIRYHQANRRIFHVRN